MVASAMIAVIATLIAAVVTPVATVVAAAAVVMRVVATGAGAAIALSRHRHGARQQRNEERTHCQAFHKGSSWDADRLQLRRSFALLR
jgi:hypothetical protein